MKFYLAGPMTGIPQFNYPAFHAAATRLRADGHSVLSPAEQDGEQTQREAMASATGDLSHCAETIGQMMSRDIKFVIDDADAIVFLPDWQKSKGARIEAMAALVFGKRFALFYPDAPGGMVALEREHVLDKIAESLR